METRKEPNTEDFIMSIITNLHIVTLIIPFKHN